MISPSDEDSFTFTVSAANGDIFKLRGKYVGGTLTGPSGLYFLLHLFYLFCYIFYYLCHTQYLPLCLVRM